MSGFLATYYHELRKVNDNLYSFIQSRLLISINERVKYPKNAVNSEERRTDIKIGKIWIRKILAKFIKYESEEIVDNGLMKTIPKMIVTRLGETDYDV